jgi:hypothetical protein
MSPLPHLKRSIRCRTAAIALIAALGVSGCGGAAPPAREGAAKTADRPATPEERKAAQALSLAGAAAPDASDPYAAAVACEAAVAIIAEHFAESSLINDAQRRSLDAARNVFRGRAEKAAVARGVGGEDLALAFEDARLAAGRQRADSARTGLACLKSLESDG